MSVRGSRYDDAVQYFADYARVDWVPVHNVLVAANGILGPGSTLQEITGTGIAISFDLLLRGVVFGDLVAGQPGFRPWPGTHPDWLRRLECEIAVLDDIPDPGESAWLHIVKTNQNGDLMAGTIEIRSGSDWTAATWLYELALSVTIELVEDANIRTHLSECLSSGFGWTSFRDYSPAAHLAVLRAIETGLVAEADRLLPMSVPNRDGVLAYLRELAELATAAR